MIKDIYLNAKQKQFVQGRQKTRVFLGGRGSGKSVACGVSSYMKAAALPRGKIFMAAQTYYQILTKTLPECENIWNTIGLVEGFHYVVGIKPPKGWERPYKPPKKYDNVITFRNGFTIELLSMDRQDSGRGGNYDGGEIDEMALVKREAYHKVLVPTIRGNMHRFSHWLHQNISGYTTIPWKPSGYYVLEFEEMAKAQPDEFLVVESTAWDNVHILGKESIERWEREMTYLEYQIEVMNRRIMKVPDGFYAAFDDTHHVYQPEYVYGEGERGIKVEGTRDVRDDQLLEASFDFSGWFNCMTVWQEQDDVERCVDQFWVKEEKLHALLEQFTHAYRRHKFKFVRIWGEPRGHDKQPMTPSIYESIAQWLAEAGWDFEVCVGPRRTTLHVDRHNFITDILQERQLGLPRVRVNQEQCKDLIIALQTTEITQDFKKDKSKERDRNFPQEHAPHLTDTLDYYLVQKHGWKVGDQHNARAGSATFL